MTFILINLTFTKAVHRCFGALYISLFGLKLRWCLCVCLTVCSMLSFNCLKIISCDLYFNKSDFYKGCPLVLFIDTYVKHSFYVINEKIKKYEPRPEKTMWFLNRSDTNQAVHVQKMARGWEFWM